MLLLHAVPEPVISDKKAFDVARQILKLDPLIALHVMC